MSAAYACFLQACSSMNPAAYACLLQASTLTTLLLVHLLFELALVAGLIGLS